MPLNHQPDAVNVRGGHSFRQLRVHAAGSQDASVMLDGERSRHHLPTANHDRMLPLQSDRLNNVAIRERSIEVPCERLLVNQYQIRTSGNRL